MVRTFVYFDTSTIDISLMHQIYSTNSQLRPIEQNIYIFEFDAIVFTHALMLLGQNSNRFGYDLSLYLNTVVKFFGKTSASLSGLIVIDEGSTDFRKRISEDLGVGISSLFMVQSLSLKWETITQIPRNKKLSNKTPDFLGFDSNDKRFIYESKGTTRPDTVESAMNKALEQSKGYPESAVGKFAIVSYFPAGSKIIPPFTFIADPPITDIFQPDKENSILLHYTYVLGFVGLENTLQAYQNLLVEKFKLDRQDGNERNLPLLPRNLGIQRFLDRIRSRFEQEIETRERIGWRNRTFIGRFLDAPDGRNRVFLGVHLETIEQVLRLDTNIQEFQDTRIREAEEEISVFSDGTMLRIQGLNIGTTGSPRQRDPDGKKGMLPKTPERTAPQETSRSNPNR